MKRKPSRVWVEINLDYIAHNYNEIKKHVGEKVAINAIIKADGYGHGAIEMAKILSKNNVDMLSTATLDEALQIRKKNITKPILVLGYIDSKRINEVIENNITISIFSYELAIKISKAAKAINKIVEVHFKIDTGMNRIGFHYSNIENILNALKLDNLKAIGIFTHFSKADIKDKDYTKLQYDRFLNILEQIKVWGFNIPFQHACNSGGVILHKNKHLNMVRPGIIIYGLYPSIYAKEQSTLDLKPAMVFKSRVIEIKKINKDQPISYGGNYITSKKTKIATIACGYADGFSRQLSGKVNVSINNNIVPVVGNICMDMCMVDVTGINVNEGDEVVLFNSADSIKDIANLCNTLNYEIVCKIGMRVPRVYIKNSKIIKIQNYLL